MLVVPQEPLMVPASIPPEATFEPVHLKYTLSPYSPPLDEHVDGKALKLMSAGCQFYDQFHFEAHLISGPRSSPQYAFFGLIGH